jgi:hypothetical protein
MTIKNPNAPTGGRPPAKPILRAEIEEAQRHTKSNSQAAKYLNVPYKRYKQYAELYGLFAGHLNVRGVGIDKGFGKKPTSIPLRDILSGKHPTYSLSKLKNRLIARQTLSEHCALCGFHERRITDGKVPLMLSFKDGNRSHMQLDNLELRCYNCMFLTTGAPSVVYRGYMERSLRADLPPYTRHYDTDPIPADAIDPSDDLPTSDVTLTPEELEALYNPD